MEAVEASLSIGDLATRTGVSAATLRVWEARHGFPVPHRRDSGHRRYDDDHVVLVQDVVRRRADGIRLDVAIHQAVNAHEVSVTAPGAPSVFARLRHTHPGLHPQRITKGTLLGLSWAIEDELASRPQRAALFGGFQRAKHFDSARERWTDLARTMSSVLVFADFDPDSVASRPVAPGVPTRVSLPADHPMIREWAVVCDGDDLAIALTAWELPGQGSVRDHDRVFETVWTLEREAVREAARACAQVAVDRGAPDAGVVVDRLAGPPGPDRADLAQVTSLFNRVVAYVDSRVVSHP